MHRLLFFVLVSAMTLSGCSNSSSDSGTPAGPLALSPVFTSINFDLLMGMVQSPDPADNRWFALERAGRVRVFADDYGVTNAQAPVVLDISSSVDTGGEGGLLGIAFHPEFGPDSVMTKNGFVFLSYISNVAFRSRISRFQMNAARDAIDPMTEVVLMQLDQPGNNHNGGNIAFGPDGYLYIGFGDGGGSNDEFGNGQKLSTLHANILRIDVDNPAAGAFYGIPADNPYYNAIPTCLTGLVDGVNVGNCPVERLNGMTPENSPEIYASGFRNPWRWSFDINPANPDVSLWVGDVGQNDWEEVDLVIKGANYGWNTMEGFNCFNPPSGCDMTGLALPVVEYANGNNGDISITGGFVYRGSEIPTLYGTYIYGDYGSGRVWRLNNPYITPVVEELFLAGSNIVSFAQSRNGEIFLIHFGSVQKLVSASP